MNLEKTARQWADSLIDQHGHGEEAQQVLEGRLMLLRDAVIAMLAAEERFQNRCLEMERRDLDDMGCPF